MVKRAVVAALLITCFSFSLALAEDADVPAFDDLSVNCQPGNGWVENFCGKIMKGRWANKTGFGPYARVGIESSTAEGVAIYYAYDALPPNIKAEKVRAKATMIAKGGESYLEIVFPRGAQLTLRPGKSGLDATHMPAGFRGASSSTTFVEVTK